jgi:hypothetical protein
MGRTLPISPRRHGGRALRPDVQVRCSLCGAVLPGWLPIPDQPDGAMLLQHLGQLNPPELKPYLARMAAGEEIGEVAAEAYEVVEEHV